MSEKYSISINMNVLNHLGINLYSNIPAVLSEIVANSWDADASTVKIIIESNPGQEEIRITDDGFGMTEEELNSHFLTVGFQKRTHGQAETPHGRKVIGRKGIGKLSMFSIANIIEVYSSKDGKEVNAFQMDSGEIQKMIQNGGDEVYHPKEISPSSVSFSEPGTTIILKSLKKNMNKATPTFLKKRIARRFNIIDSSFEVFVNNEKVTLSDRGYASKVEYLWSYGAESHKEIQNVNVETRENIIIVDGEAFRVSGWIGTVHKSSDLAEADDNINRISILVRGKVGLENILSELSNGGLFTKYLIGEINADFFDDDNRDDMATTSRQDFDKSDKRYIMLLDFLEKELKYIQGQWTRLRNQAGEKKAAELIPEIQEWIDSLGKDDRKIATNILGNINQMEVDDDNKKTLFQYGVLAFEKYKIKNSLSKLENVNVENLQAIIDVFTGADEVEAALYYQIVKERLKILSQFQNILDEDLKEKVIQKYLFDHLWLLDPSWERAESTQRMEQRIYNALDADKLKLTKEEKDSRLDIKYRTVAGKTVVIELKRYGRKISGDELGMQVSKYSRAIKKLLAEDKSFPQAYEIVCILGNKLEDDEELEKNMVEKLAIDHGRYITYDNIICNTQRIYKEYIEAERKARNLVSLLGIIDEDM